jgi:hypothetical protein
MFRIPFRWVLLATAVLGPWPVAAQGPNYSELKVEALATGEELAAQPDLWVMEVYFKPMRQIIVPITDPQTGKQKPEYIWYLPYRAVNRRLTTRNVPAAAVNDLDPPVIPPLFIPEFTLITTDTDEPKIYRDEIIPEALAAINKRERRTYKSSVGVVTEVPPAVDPGDPNEQFIYGVATWRGIDPDADRYTVYMTGFSNGMRKAQAPDGTEFLQTKTIQTKYWRPGDRFELKEREIRIDPGPLTVDEKTRPEDRDPGMPRWIYR